MKYLTRLLLGETEWAPKKTSEGFVPFDANALGTSLTLTLSLIL